MGCCVGRVGSDKVGDKVLRHLTLDPSPRRRRRGEPFRWSCSKGLNSAAKASSLLRNYWDEE